MNKNYDCCNYCCLDNDGCPCHPSEEIKDEFTCDFYVANFDKAVSEAYNRGRADAINAIKNDLHKRGVEEMNKPHQDQGICQGLYFGIQRCDWYLDDRKEQNE